MCVEEISLPEVFFGLHLEYSPLNRSAYGRDISPILNTANVIGWIPVVGVVVGVARLAFALYWKISMGDLFEDSGCKRMLRFLVARAVVETFSLGFLLVIPDLLLTKHREEKFSRLMSGEKRV